MKIEYNHDEMIEYKKLHSMMVELLKQHLLFTFLMSLPLIAGILSILFKWHLAITIFTMVIGVPLFVVIMVSTFYNIGLCIKTNKDDFFVIRTQITQNTVVPDDDYFSFYTVKVSPQISRKSIVFLSMKEDKFYTLGNEIDVIMNKRNKPMFAIPVIEIPELVEETQ